MPLSELLKITPGIFLIPLNENTVNIQIDKGLKTPDCFLVLIMRGAIRLSEAAYTTYDCVVYVFASSAFNLWMKYTASANSNNALAWWRNATAMFT
jgi:hypothetical protein